MNPGTTGANAGSDHGWGSHAMLVGGAVRGGDFYGMPGANGTMFPTLVSGGPDDAESRGRFIPTTSVEMFAATLASWYGVAAADIPLVFPLINRFRCQISGSCSKEPKAPAASKQAARLEIVSQPVFYLRVKNFLPRTFRARCSHIGRTTARLILFLWLPFGGKRISENTRALCREVIASLYLFDAERLLK